MFPIFGLPVTLQLWNGAFAVEKRQNGGRLTKNACVSHSPFNKADFCGKGTGHFRSSVEQIWKSIWNEHKIVAWSGVTYLLTARNARWHEGQQRRSSTPVCSGPASEWYPRCGLGSSPLPLPFIARCSSFCLSYACLLVASVGLCG